MLRPVEDEALKGGGRAGAARRGDQVVRRAGTWTPAVVALLRHLERCGYPYSPRVVDTAEPGEEVLRFIDGDVNGRQDWSDDAMVQLGTMLRGLHDATATFEAPPDAEWQGNWWVRSRAHDAIIGHGDPAPWNIVARAGTPVALLDWEFAGPVDRLHEVAHAAWLNAQLYADDVVAPPTADRLRRLRLFVDGYGLEPRERHEFVDRLVEVAVLSAANEADDANVTPETKVGPLWGVTWRVRSAAWMIQNRRLLEATLR